MVAATRTKRRDSGGDAMADPSPHPDATTGTGLGRDDGPAPGTPRWVKISGIIAVVVAVLFVILLIFGGGNHGPARHLPPADAIEHGPRQP
jgi:hypothetical protein